MNRRKQQVNHTSLQMLGTLCCGAWDQFSDGATQMLAVEAFPCIAHSSCYVIFNQEINPGDNFYCQTERRFTWELLAALTYMRTGRQCNPCYRVGIACRLLCSSQLTGSVPWPRYLGTTCLGLHRVCGSVTPWCAMVSWLGSVWVVSQACFGGHGALLVGTCATQAACSGCSCFKNGRCGLGWACRIVEQKRSWGVTLYSHNTADT